MGTELTVSEKKALTALGKQATKHHRLCIKSLGDAVYNANMSGAFLIQAKEGVPHGEWLDWLATDFPDGCEKTAENYMKISRNWTELEQNRNAVANWSIRGVLKFLTKPREPEPLSILPPEQRADCQKDYADECEATGEEPTADGLRAAVELYQADNVPYDGSDGDPDASEPEPDETPTPTSSTPTHKRESPCEAFRTTLERTIRNWVVSNPKDRQPIACWLEHLSLEIRTG